jgi:hypothetical protein
MARTMPTDRIAFRINKPVISLPPLSGVMIDRESRHSGDTKTIPRVRRPHLSRTKSSAENPQSRDRHKPSAVPASRSLRASCAAARAAIDPTVSLNRAKVPRGGLLMLRGAFDLCPLWPYVGQSLSPLAMSCGLLDLRRVRNCKVRPPPRALRNRTIAFAVRPEYGVLTPRRHLARVPFWWSALCRRWMRRGCLASATAGR